MTTAHDTLAEAVTATTFTVRYEVSSTVEVSATSDDLETFMGLCGEDTDLMTYETLRRKFLAWCIEEGGFDFNTRGSARIINVQANS